MESGEWIGVSDDTLRILIRNDTLVGQEIGKQWAVTVETFAAYGERCKPPDTTL